MAGLLPAIPVARRFRFLSNAGVDNPEILATREFPWSCTPSVCYEIAAAILLGNVQRICRARKLWITALAIPQRQIQMKPFAGAPITRQNVNSHV
jgi:hypothetical protein